MGRHGEQQERSEDEEGESGVGRTGVVFTRGFSFLQWMPDMKNGWGMGKQM